jgi:hypothetical protein
MLTKDVVEQGNGQRHDACGRRLFVEDGDDLKWRADLASLEGSRE